MTCDKSEYIIQPLMNLIEININFIYMFIQDGR